MVNSPISIPLAASLSRKPSDLVKTQALAAYALKIERYINSRMDQAYIREFDFATLAVELAMGRERIGALLSKLAGQEMQSLSVTLKNDRSRPPLDRQIVAAIYPTRVPLHGLNPTPSHPKQRCKSPSDCLALHR